MEHRDSGVLVELALTCCAHHSGSVRHDFGTETLLNVELVETHSSAYHAPSAELPARATLAEMHMSTNHQVANRIVP